MLDWFRARRGIEFELWQLDLGAERYLRDGTTFPAEVRDEIASSCAAVLLGALGDARVPGFEHAREILFGMRMGFDLYANVRPVRALSDRFVPLRGRTARDVDFVVFRENTEGIYAGIGGQLRRGSADEIAINEDINTRKGVERIIRAAFAYARRSGRQRVLMSDKSNAMRHAHELWQRVFQEVRLRLPGDRRQPPVHRCLVPGAGARSEPVPSDRDQQLVRRHRDRPGGRVAGRDGRRRQCQLEPRPPGAGEAVRARARLGTQAGRARYGQPGGDAVMRRPAVRGVRLSQLPRRSSSWPCGQPSKPRKQHQIWAAR